MFIPVASAAAALHEPNEWKVIYQNEEIKGCGSTGTTFGIIMHLKHVCYYLSIWNVQKVHNLSC